MRIMDNELEVNSTSRAAITAGRLGSQWGPALLPRALCFEPTKCAYQARKTWWLGEEEKRTCDFFTVHMRTCEVSLLDRGRRLCHVNLEAVPADG